MLTDVELRRFRHKILVDRISHHELVDSLVMGVLLADPAIPAADDNPYVDPLLCTICKSSTSL